MHWVLTRTITHHFTDDSLKGAKRFIEKFNLEDADETYDTLTCEETGEEELL